jgi:NAD(P)-dependent dehydrogenase (short-subunit alcohol dehydrogenase family)
VTGTVADTPPDNEGRARFRGQRAVVTGAASGIGAAVVRQLVAEGANVAALDRNPIAADAEGVGTQVVSMTLDVRNPQAIESAIGKAVGALGGPPHVLILAAGVYRFSPLLETSVEEWDDIHAVNLRALFLIAKAVVRRTSAVGQTLSIVNFSSTAAYRGARSEPSAAYNTSKAAVITLTRQEALEWAPFGVRSNAIAPGMVDTPMLRIMDNPEVGLAFIDASIPAKRLGTSKELASLACFLASEEASYITGSVIVADGGRLLT